MIKKNKIQNTNNITAYDLSLSFGFRVKISLYGFERDNYLTDLQFVPRVGDYIEAKKMIDKKKYSHAEIKEICYFFWIVTSVKWSKDEKGYFAEIMCDAE